MSITCVVTEITKSRFYCPNLESSLTTCAYAWWHAYGYLVFAPQRFESQPVRRICVPSFFVRPFSVDQWLSDLVLHNPTDTEFMPLSQRPSKCLRRWATWICVAAWACFLTDPGRRPVTRREDILGEGPLTLPRALTAVEVCFMPAQEASAGSTLRRKSKEKCAEPEKCPATQLHSQERIVSSAVSAMFGHALQRAPGRQSNCACVE